MSNFCSNRKHVEVVFPSGKKKIYPFPTNGNEIAKDEELKGFENIIALKLNNQTMNLNCPIKHRKVEVQPIVLNSPEGKKMHRRTLIFLLGMATKLEYPQLYLTIEHHIPNGIDLFQVLNAFRLLL